MRTFVLYRKADETGVSGAGVVAEGVEFHDGRIALRWLAKYRSTAFYADADTVLLIHGHDGATELLFYDDVMRRGASDAEMDSVENAWFQSVGGPRAPHFNANQRIAIMVAPNYITAEQEARYLAGYKHKCFYLYGLDWATRLYT